MSKSKVDISIRLREKIIRILTTVNKPLTASQVYQNVAWGGMRMEDVQIIINNLVADGAIDVVRKKTTLQDMSVDYRDHYILPGTLHEHGTAADRYRNLPDLRDRSSHGLLGSNQ